MEHLLARASSTSFAFNAATTLTITHTHPKQRDSGRTSAVGQEILGFSAEGQVVNHNIYKRASGSKHGPQYHWDAICAQVRVKCWSDRCLPSGEVLSHGVRPDLL